MAQSISLIVLFMLAVAHSSCTDRLLLHPTTMPIDARGAERRTIKLDNDHDIEVWIARSPGMTSREPHAEPQAYVLEFTGNGTRAEQIATFVAMRWKDKAIEAWVMNYPGFGGSTGPATVDSVPPAALKCYDELRKIAGDKPIFLEANSLGTTMALYVASQRSTPAIILQNPPPLRRLIMQRYAWWNLGILALPVAYSVPDAMNSTLTAPQVKVPAVFLMSDHDETIPPYYSKIVYDAYAGPKTMIVLKNAGHNDSIPHDAEIELSHQIDRLWSLAFPTTQPVKSPE